ncbi:MULTISPECIES: amino acid ABC transporter permease [Agrobacterium tumefaciens complex]|jgi:polar amino acid transport system permease protein|uniref:Amine acid ABC transporter, permease protein, 3-TM region, His/Glu/Gln/Arg/opine family n=1 Tax=Agrobacterium genomosp. 13 str. CFBP 6927 TaxID=1183428 RepID=A0ABM9VJX5_9HYPH|nr:MULTISPECIES: amino acid ABC transporter permease [Agrobacterium tumefaciens complex]UXS34712.1 amino acid ABC transporter permease [Agrobacterium tumefaciens]CDN95229.1 Polar amino acid ABC transporter, inner membrane subunit [Agrobacterium tumefaciens]CUX50672.1 Amine acid ABC transporter, permease protein, 3-TM region, His/Glu/Gln/Arg/opine family [Agrobacterium genomosp. 13 str. CFBP 6927]
MYFGGSFSWGDLQFLLSGAVTTLSITLVAVVIGTVLGVLFGLVRAGAPWWIGNSLGAVLDVFRSVPLLIQLVLFNSFNSMLKLNWPTFVVGCVCLGIYASAFCTEIVRSGVGAVPQTTRRAARSLGLSWRQELTSITLPIATRIVFPSWIGLTLGVMKDTALVLWIGIVELLRSSQIVTSRVQEPLLILGITGLIYFAMSFPIARLGNQLEKKWGTQ